MSLPGHWSPSVSQVKFLSHRSEAEQDDVIILPLQTQNRL